MSNAKGTLDAMQAVIDAARGWGPRALELQNALDALGARGIDEAGAEVREYIAQVFEDLARVGGTHIDDDVGTSTGLELSAEQCLAIARRVRSMEGETLNETLDRERDALRAENERLRRRIETMPPFPNDREPVTDEQMAAIRMRWAFGPEKYQADADALIATVLGLRARMQAVGRELERNGCDCECEHHVEEHDADCERCLACRVDLALGGEELAHG